MARLDVKTSFNYRGPKAVENIIKDGTNKIFRNIARDIVAKAEGNLIDIIKDKCKNLREAESKVWDALGKAERPHPGEFGSITEELKKGTGYSISLNGVRISSSNTLAGGRSIGSVRFRESKFKSHKTDRLFVRNIQLGIVIFSKAPYSDFVNNPERKRLKYDSVYKGKENYRVAGELYAGTGWFDIYSVLLVNMFYKMFYTTASFDNENVAGIVNLKKSIADNFIKIAAARNMTNYIINGIGRDKHTIEFTHKYVKGRNGRKGHTKYFAKPMVVKNFTLHLDYDDIKDYLLW